MKLIFESWNKFLKENIDNEEIKKLTTKIQDGYGLKHLFMYLREPTGGHPVRSLYISNIQTHELGTGIGSQALQEIVDFADKNNLVITLIPVPTEKKDTERLRKWYERFGFEDWYFSDDEDDEAQYLSSDEDDEERKLTKYMIRKPKK